MSNENEIAKEIVDAAYKIHVKTGPGLFESAYETMLVYELRKRGLHIQQQQPNAFYLCVFAPLRESKIRLFPQ